MAKPKTAAKAKATKSGKNIMVRLSLEAHQRWQAAADENHEGNLAQFVRMTVNRHLEGAPAETRAALDGK